MSHASSPVKKRPSGIVTLSLSFLFRCVLISLISIWFLTIWFGLKSIFVNANDILLEVQHILSVNLDFIINNPSHWVQILLQPAWQILTKIIDDIHRISFPRIQFLNNFISLVLLIVEINLSRLLICVLAFPLFALVLIVCLTDGLVKRDIWKFQGARETTFKFHRAKHLLSMSFFVLFFCFMSAPWAISPLGFLVPEVLFIGVLTRFISTHFKKYV